MRVVLDSSVLIAAAISRAGTCSAVLEDVIAHHDLIFSEFILEEVDRKVRGKLQFPVRDVRALISLLRRSSFLVTPANLPANACRDPNDVPVLGTAVSGQAAALITGDEDLLELRNYEGVRIIRPTQFWNLREAHQQE